MLENESLLSFDNSCLQFAEGDRNKIINYEIGDRSKWTYFKLYTRVKNKE